MTTASITALIIAAASSPRRFLLRTPGAAVLAMLIVGQSPAPSEADWNWLEKFREAAFDVLMPIKMSPSDLVAYRSYRDLYQTIEERHFRIAGGYLSSDSLTATVVVPVGRSIQQQLLGLHMRDPKAPFESLVSQVTVRWLVLTENKCAAIRTRLDALSKVSISLPERDVIFLHPFVHRIVLDLPGAQIDARTFDEDNPLVRWAVETTDALLACAAS